MTRSPYSAEQLSILLAVAEQKYQLSTTCEEARDWLRSTHMLSDRLSHAIALGAVL